MFGSIFEQLGKSLASGGRTRFGFARARPKRRSKVSPGRDGLVDNMIAVTVYVVVAGLALSELYRFVQKPVSR
jgi:hypothetical protein